MPRIGLVLGAGGVTGGAFHAGVLAALHEAMGWDARTADVLVGTSAGSITAATLRAGMPPADLAARAQDRQVSSEGAAILAAAGILAGPTTVPPGPERFAWGPPSSPTALLRPWKLRPAAALAALLPSGTADTAVISESINRFYGGIWPEAPLWVCAVRLSDGQRVVFGRGDSPRPPVGDAVAASCAIPGYFTPVEIDGTRYVDGGAFSLTNLGLVAKEKLDLVLVSSPMSHAGRLRPGTGNIAGSAARAQLELEARSVRRRGAHVIAFQPTAADRSVMGVQAMDYRRRAAVAAQARESTLHRLAREDVKARLAVLTQD